MFGVFCNIYIYLFFGFLKLMLDHRLANLALNFRFYTGKPSKDQLKKVYSR